MMTIRYVRRRRVGHGRERRRRRKKPFRSASSTSRGDVVRNGRISQWRTPVVRRPSHRERRGTAPRAHVRQVSHDRSGHRRYHARPKDAVRRSRQRNRRVRGRFDPVRRHHGAWFLVLDGSGVVTRAMSAPRPNDVATMANASFGAAALRQIGPTDLSKFSLSIVQSAGPRKGVHASSHARFGAAPPGGLRYARR